MRYPRVVHRYLLVAVVCCCIAPRETNQSFANKCTCSRVRLVLCTSLLHSPVGLSVPGYRHAGCLQLSHHRPPEMCGLRTRPRTDVDPPRRLDPWTDADGLIGGKTICNRRTAIGGGYRLAAPPSGRYLVISAHRYAAQCYRCNVVYLCICLSVGHDRELCRNG